MPATALEAEQPNTVRSPRQSTAFALAACGYLVGSRGVEVTGISKGSETMLARIGAALRTVLETIAGVLRTVFATIAHVVAMPFRALAKLVGRGR